METIEDCIGIFVNKFPFGKLQYALLPKHTKLIKSFNTQLKKNIALTALQHESARKILSEYRPYFIEEGISNIDLALNSTRHPHRVLIKKPSVVIVEQLPDGGIESTQYSIIKKIKPAITGFIEVTATKTFQEPISEVIRNVKIPSHIKSISHNNKYYFYPTPETIYYLVGGYKKHSAYIDPELDRLHGEYKKCHDNKQDYIPCIYQGVPLNVPDELKPHIDDIGGDIFKLVDRRWKYGLNLIETPTPDEGLLSSIAFRKDPAIEIFDETINDIVDVLKKLNRGPLLIVVDSENENIINDLELVLPRLQVAENSAVCLYRSISKPTINKFIHDRGLNKLLTGTTDTVIISANRPLPKLLYQDIWKPDAIIHFNVNYTHSTVKLYSSTMSDLQIHLDNDETIIKENKVDGL
jgi:hypothetical protein